MCIAYFTHASGIILYAMAIEHVELPGWNGSRDCARSRGIGAILRPVFMREIAFQRQNSLKFRRKLARNSFSRFEGVNHGHTPGLA